MQNKWQFYNHEVSKHWLHLQVPQNVHTYKHCPLSRAYKNDSRLQIVDNAQKKTDLTFANDLKITVKRNTLVKTHSGNFHAYVLQ